MTKAISVRFLDRTTPPHILTLILLAGVSALAMNIFLPSLPGMTAYFETDYATMQLSVALYLVGNAVLQLFIGPVSDRYGRRPVILFGCVVFVIATVACIYAPNVEVFLTLRVVQAIIISGMVLSRAVIRDMFSQDRAASMIGYVTMGMAVAPMIAPAVGGALDGLFGWKASFWVLAILGVLVTILAWKDLGETAVKSSSSLLEQVRQYPELLTSRRFWGYCLTAAFTSGAFFAYLGGAPYVGTNVFGMDAATLGLFFGAPAIGYMMGNFITGRFAVQFGINAMVLTGTFLSATGLFVALIVNVAGFSNPYTFFGFMISVGLGNGLVLPNATSGMLSVRPHLAGTASGLGGAIMIGGGAALSVLAGILLEGRNSALPLIVLMAVTAALSCASAVYTVRRDRVMTTG
ncbi:multidrug effflux MFS transporter [Oceaniglobus ichthyenteri]|uniref:multidrug effflux MFS transporter n=1 Tax=Oceaniglobus ichthyenteri TaxID=2136177 RepID=UPI000D3A8E47|nr:multidrug effflux MFS transporter [Oceaniglobus ichthyenteri]